MLHHSPSGPPGPLDRPRFAYLLLTHGHPDHVEECADRLLALSPSAQIVVHHDLAAGDPPWAGRPDGPRHLVERGPVLWGDWSMVEATERLVRFAVDQLDADWLVLLSGQHRPLVDLSRWEEATATSGVDAFARADRLPAGLRFGRAEAVAGGYLARSCHRWTAVRRPGSELAHDTLGHLMRLGQALSPIGSLEYAHRTESWMLGTPRPRGPTVGWTFFRGSQWVVLNRRAARALLEVDPVVRQWFRSSWIPDEAYIQTVVRRRPELVVSDQLVTYVLDTPARPFPGWMRLALDDLPAAWGSGAAFARKVDWATRPEVIEAIDQAVDRGRQAVPTTPARRPR